MEMDLDVDPKVDRSMEMEVDDGHSVARADAADEADEDGAGGMGASHLQVQAQVIIPTLSNGQSVGVQSDKVADLGPETAVLDLDCENVTHVCWNPRDATLLATGGDELCHIWSVPTSSMAYARFGPDGTAEPGANQNHNHNHCHINPALTPNQMIDLLEPPGSRITAMAWSPDGNSIAVAIHPKSPGARGTISVRSRTGESLDELPGGQDWVLNLLWNPSGNLLLAVTHSDDSSSVLMVWEPGTTRIIEPFNSDRTIIDVVWVDHHTIALCGKSFIASTVVGENGFDALQQLADTGPSHDWSYIRYDDISRTSVVASETSGFLGLLDPNSKISTVQAHDCEITALMYQPLSNSDPSALPLSSPRTFATAGTDGKIKLWDARRPMQLMRTLEMGGASPILALSFTYDGYLVAAASSDKILFWTTDTGGLPKATWSARNIGRSLPSTNGTLHSNGNGNIENSEMDVTDEDLTFSLSWDADGRRLAYGAKDKVIPVRSNREFRSLK